MIDGNNASKFISSDIVDNAQRRLVMDDDVSGPAILSAKISTGGRESAICLVKGNKLFSLETIKTNDVSEFVDWIAMHIGRYRPNVINVSSTGIGAAVTDRLLDARYRVRGVSSGGKPSGREAIEKYFNRRAEMWYWMRGWLVGASIIGDQYLHNELKGMEYSIDSKMRIKLMSLDDMARRGLGTCRSEALSMCFF